MLTKFDYTNAETSVVYHLNDDVSPFTDLEISVTQRTDHSREKMEQHGVWPTFSYRGGMELHVEGDLLADDSADYVSKRFALVTALFGDPALDAPTVRRNGRLDITMSGMTEDLKALVSIDAFSAPQTGSYPAYSKYLVTFFCSDPFFIGVTSGDRYYWS